MVSCVTIAFLILGKEGLCHARDSSSLSQRYHYTTTQCHLIFMANVALPGMFVSHIWFTGENVLSITTGCVQAQPCLSTATLCYYCFP